MTGVLETELFISDPLHVRAGLFGLKGWFIHKFLAMSAFFPRLTAVKAVTVSSGAGVKETRSLPWCKCPLVLCRI